ncbi:DUF4942 domain-containing protein, partial [Escherichia coli]|uniref:DUF4942 domain-containing protein n=1 Tax=Escherichia coli TaxID=562 RepID=UPI0021BA84DB
FLRTAVNDFMDSVHHIWCPLFSQEFQDLPDGAETTLTLNWNYKTNCPCKFGSKIIVNNLVRWDRWGFHLITGQQTDRLVDLERMLHLFSGKPIPDNRENITIRLDGHIQSVQGKERYEDEMFIIKYFKKGSAHITFKRLELIDRINDIIARYFPSVLSA